MSNLAQVFARQGAAWNRRTYCAGWRRSKRSGPFYFNLGLAAMEQGNFKDARDLFAKEIARAHYHAESHYWLAVANVKLGDIEPARKAFNSCVGKWCDTQ